jgi:hypothetical protein
MSEKSIKKRLATTFALPSSSFFLFTRSHRIFSEYFCSAAGACERRDAFGVSLWRREGVSLKIFIRIQCRGG